MFDGVMVKVMLGVIVWDGLAVLASRWIHDEAYTHGFILVALVGFSAAASLPKFPLDWSCIEEDQSIMAQVCRDGSWW